MTVRDERDTWLAGLARAGNDRARDELVQRHWRLVHHIVGCGLVERADVDRALAELAERLRHTAPDSEPVRAWFVGEARRQVRAARRPGRAGSGGPDFAAAAVAGLGLTGQARHLVEALRWLAPHDRDAFALWWLAEAGELTPAEVEAVSGHSPSEADDRVRRMAPRLGAARLLVAAFAAEPVCGDLALLAGGTARRPQPHRRDRLAAHVSECARCVTELEPIGPLLGCLGLVPAVPPPAPRVAAPSRSSAAPNVETPARRNTIWRRLSRSRRSAASPDTSLPGGASPGSSPGSSPGASPGASPGSSPGASPGSGAAPSTSLPGGFSPDGPLPGSPSPDAGLRGSDAPDAGLRGSHAPDIGGRRGRAFASGPADPAGRRGGSGSADGAGSTDLAAQRGAAGSRRYAGRRNSAAGWTDLALGGADLADSPPVTSDSSPVTSGSQPFSSGSAVGDDSAAAAPDTVPVSGRSAPRSPDAVPGSRGSATGSPDAALASRRSGTGSPGAVMASSGAAMGSAGVRRPGGFVAAGFGARSAGPVALVAAAGVRAWASLRGLVSGAADTASAFRYRGRRFKSDALPRRAILVALLIAMLAVVAVVANRSTRSAAPVHDPGPVPTTATLEPSPAAVTTVPPTPAKNLAPPGRAVAPGRMPAPAVTSAAPAPTTPRPPVTTSYEAEAARFVGAAESMTMPEASGGRIVHKLGTGNDPYGNAVRGAIEFTVNAPAARRYTLTVYYVDGEQQRTAYMRLNGGQSQAWSFQPGGWNRVMSASFPIDLRAGANSLYFHNPAYWMPRLDRITLTPTS